MTLHNQMNCKSIYHFCQKNVQQHPSRQNVRFIDPCILLYLLSISYFLHFYAKWLAGKNVWIDFVLKIANTRSAVTTMAHSPGVGLVLCRLSEKHRHSAGDWRSTCNLFHTRAPKKVNVANIWIQNVSCSLAGLNDLITVVFPMP